MFRFIDIDIIDDSLEEDDETFFVKLSVDRNSANQSRADRRASENVTKNSNMVDEHITTGTNRPLVVEIGRNSVCTVVIINDDG